MYATPAVVGAISYTLLQKTKSFPDWVLLVVPFALTLSLRAAAWTYRRVRHACTGPACAARGRKGGSEPPTRAPQARAPALGAQAAECLLLLLEARQLRNPDQER